MCQENQRNAICGLILAKVPTTVKSICNVLKRLLSALELNMKEHFILHATASAEKKMRQTLARVAREARDM